MEHDRDLTIKALELGKTSTWKEKEMQPHRERRRFPQRTYRTTTTNTKNEHEFRQRVDRHGRPFGERVDTRHARNPPPEKPALSRKPNSRSTTRPKVQSIKEVEVTSPQYVHHRDKNPPEADTHKIRLLKEPHKPMEEKTSKPWQGERSSQ